MKNLPEKSNQPPPPYLKKRLGQHILMDQAILQSIAGYCGITPETTVFEIGAGVANLTEALARRAKKVIAVEIDPRFKMYHLRLLTKYSNVEFLYEDVLDMNWEEFEPKGKAGDLVITGNIPYNITTPLVMKILEQITHFGKMVLMVQKEVGQRLTAPPGTRHTSAVTLKIRYFCDTELLREVSRKAFHPPPRVASALVRFTPRIGRPYSPETRKRFFRLLEAAFVQRRKTLINSLGHAMKAQMSKTDLERYLQSAGIEPGKRPETILLEQYQPLFELLEEIKPSELLNSKKNT